MKKLLYKHLCDLVYGGLSRQEYLEIKDEVLEKDRKSLSMASVCLVVMFIGLFLGSLYSELMAVNRLAYGLVGIAFLVIRLVCQLMKKRVRWLIVPLWYTALTLICAYAIILNTVIRKDISATTFCIIMIVAPLLIIDRPWRVFGYFGITAIIFVLVAFHQKPYYLAFTDTVNVLCCLFLGSFIHFQIIRTKLQEMMQKRYIERERDTDKLTGCLTKAAFQRRIEENLNASGQGGILFVMDLDYFKSINDNYGHVFGDMVLRTVGEYIRESFPETELRGRFGGDEFQVWLPGQHGRKEIGLRLDGLLSHIRSVETPDGRIRVSVSIGASVSPENGTEYPMLFESADAALYTAKNLGRGRYVFCPELRMKGKVRGKREWDTILSK